VLRVDCWRSYRFKRYSYSISVKLFMLRWSVCVCYQGWEQISELYSFSREVVGRATSWFCVSIGLPMLPQQLIMLKR